MGRYGFKGTPDFASVNALEGKALSRRDDLECLGYSFLSLVEPASIPWKGMTTQSAILQAKLKFLSLEEEDVPANTKGVWAFIKYARGLSYSGEPDYQYMEEIIRNGFFPVPPQKEIETR
jgi:hypothetical protein